MEKKKVVLKLEVYDDRDKQRAMRAASSLPGIESIAIDMKEKKLTVIGDVDPIEVVSKLRRLWHTDLITVGPAKEPEKKKEEPKKEAEKKNDDKKKVEEKQLAEYTTYYRNHNPYLVNQYYYAQSAEENPNSCVIS